MQTTKTRKPTQPQLTLLLRAIANGGYLTADFHTGINLRVMQRCIEHGWMREDGRIITAGRTAVLTADSLAYQLAVAESDARDIRHPRPAARTFGPVPAAQIPDEMVSYDVPAGRRLEDFVGYHIWVGDRLEMLAHAETRWNGEFDDRSVLYIADDYGNLKCVGTAYVEVVCFAQPGGPDLRDQAAKLIADRKAHAAAHPAMPADVTVIREEADPGTTPVDATLVQAAADQHAQRRAALDAAMTGGRPAASPELDLAAPENLPASTRDALDRTRSAIVGALGAHADDRPAGLRPHIDAISGDPTAAGYRRAVRDLRLAGITTEKIRRALFQFDYAIGLAHRGCGQESAVACSVAAAILSE